MSKPGKPQKAPKVPNSRPKDNFMRENDTKNTSKRAGSWPLKPKRLSK